MYNNLLLSIAIENLQIFSVQATYSCHKKYI